MKLKITFHNMPHSEPLEAHAHEKFSKVDELITHMENSSPMHAEIWLKANKQHSHHAVEFHLKTPHLDLNSHDEGTDMYIALDNAIDKMVKQVKKAKDKNLDRHHKIETEKTKFTR